MPNPPTISVIMITGNVLAHTPGRAVFEQSLESIVWADQIVIVDSESTDGTREVASRYTADIHVHPYRQSLKLQKQIALRYVTGDWVLWVDADEILPAALIEEIRAAVRQPIADGYYIWRLHYFLGRPLVHCGRDRVIRLWRRGVGEFAGTENHEYYTIPGTAPELPTALLHQCTMALGPRLEKQVFFARGQAANAPLPARADYRLRDIWRDILRSPLENMYSIYYVNRGYKDGIRGFLWTLISGCGELFTQILIWERAQRELGALDPVVDKKESGAEAAGGHR